MTDGNPSSRTVVKRLPERGNYELETIRAILDEGLICHVGFVVEGQPVVIPTGYGRVGDRVYIHGSPASRMLRSVSEDVDICFTVTLLDGLVLARSAFHHSMNYRSVVIFAKAREVRGAEKAAALAHFVEHILPGRSSESRPPSELELRKTLVLAIPITEGSAKIRKGPPIDDDEDYSLPHWAGVLPVRMTASAPIADPRLDIEIAVPEHVTKAAVNWRG